MVLAVARLWRVAETVTTATSAADGRIAVEPGPSRIAGVAELSSVVVLAVADLISDAVPVVVAHTEIVVWKRVADANRIVAQVFSPEAFADTLVSTIDRMTPSLHTSLCRAERRPIRDFTVPPKPPLFADARLVGCAVPVSTAYSWSSLLHIVAKDRRVWGEAVAKRTRPRSTRTALAKAYIVAQAVSMTIADEGI